MFRPVASFDNMVLFSCDDNKLYLFVKPLPHLLIWWGVKLKWFNCYRKAKLCGKPLHRPHLTCVKCYLRRVVSNDLPNPLQVNLHLLVYHTSANPVKKAVIKNLLSLIEHLTR